MGQYKYLIKNIGFLTLSSFSTKLLGFFLVPLYTNILTTTEYGTYEMINTTIGVLLPVLTLNIQEAVLCFSLDKKKNRGEILSVARHYLILSNCMVGIGLVINLFFSFSQLLKEYSLFFFIMFFVQSLSGVVMAYTRGIDRIADLSVSSVLSSIVTIGCNILFLVGFKWGMIGYLLANNIGPAIQCLYLILRAKMLTELKGQKKTKKESDEMTGYSKPLIANSLAWWVNNALDKYVIILFCGLPENGIYSIASKIPSILNIFQSIFAQAWTLSAVRDFDPEDKNGFFTNTYATYNCFMVVMCSAIIMADKILAGFLYAKDFYIAWRYVPWLTIAIVFGSLSGYIGGFFTAVKQPKVFAKSTIIGASVNFALNIILIPHIGALGAAIATTTGYCFTWIFRFMVVKKFVRLRVKIVRDIVTYVLLILQAIVLLLIDEAVKLYSVECGIFIFICFLYCGDMRQIIKKIMEVIKKNITR